MAHVYLNDFKEIEAPKIHPLVRGKLSKSNFSEVCDGVSVTVTAGEYWSMIQNFLLRD